MWKAHKAVKYTSKVTNNLFRFLNFMQRFMRFNELTIFHPTIPTWDCVSSRVHRTSQKIPRKDLQKEMNEEFELITVTISLAATAKRKQLSNCHRQTSFQCSHAKHVTSRNLGRREEILPCCALTHLWNKTSCEMFDFCPRLKAKVPLPPI